jgi:hypothetical protein
VTGEHNAGEFGHPSGTTARVHVPDGSHNLICECCLAPTKKGDGKHFAFYGLAVSVTMTQSVRVQ